MSILYRKGRLKQRDDSLSVIREAKGAKGHRGIRMAMEKLAKIDDPRGRTEKVRAILTQRDQAERADRTLDGLLASTERQ